MDTSLPFSCLTVSPQQFELGHIRLADDVLRRVTALLGDESNARFVIAGLLDAHKQAKHGRIISQEDRALNAHVLGELRSNGHCIVSGFQVRGCIIEVVTNLAESRTTVRLGPKRNSASFSKH